MKIPVRQIAEQDSDYHRCSQRWVCGWTRDGNPCRFGPDGKGQCTAHAQTVCSPVSRGDRWFCSRAEAFGGSCKDGPRPDGSCCRPTPEHQVCQPALSLRAKRTRLVLAVCLFTLGLLVFLLAGDSRLWFIFPGELSASHRAIVGQIEQENCVLCHQSGDKNMAGWLKTAVGIDNGHTANNSLSAKCLSCHFSETAMSREQALNVHGKPVEAAAELVNTDDSQLSIFAGLTSVKLKLADVLHGSVDVADGPIACATCHQEHRGSQNDLKKMSDTQCQVCHQQQFDSFNNGHPEFNPVKRTISGITFDHDLHQPRFKDDSLECKQCHVADASGTTMLVKPFESSCKGCHHRQTSDYHGDEIKEYPLVFLQLPTIAFDNDVYWPTDRAFAETLTPMMVILLSGDDQALPILASIYDQDGPAGELDGWFAALEKTDQQGQKAQLAEVIKRLIADLADHTPSGAQARKKRLAKAFGTTIEDPYIDNVASELASANFVMQMFKQRYLGQLDADLAGEVVSTQDDVQSENPWMASDSTSGWEIDSQEGIISYRPVTHGDHWLKYWIETLRFHSFKDIPLELNDMDKTRLDLRRLMYEELGDDFEICTACHTEQNNLISWQVAGREHKASGFALFNHSPHVAMLLDSDCTSCHVLSGEVKADSTPILPRGFLPLQKNQCASCHAPERADNSCLQCHQYHQN